MRRVLFAFTGIAAAVFIMAIGGVDNVVRSQSSLPAPTGVSAVNGDNHGEAVVSWQAVADAAYYRIGWMADEDYQAAFLEPNQEWAKEFRYSNVVNRGQTSHTITRLTPGIKYWIIVGSHDAFYGGPEWSSWAEVTLVAAPTPTRPDGGSGGPVPEPQPTNSLPFDGSRYEAISSGRLHTCGVRVDGTVGCFGSDGRGQSSPPDGEFLHVSAGGNHSCGVKADNTIVCWGSSAVPSPPADRKFAAVSSGDSHACGLIAWAGGDVNHEVICWGATGLSRTDDWPSSAQIEKVSVGDNHNCVVRQYSSGGLRSVWYPKIACWGSNEANQRSASPARDVSAGGAHTCWLQQNGTVGCQGSDASGQSTTPTVPEGDFDQEPYTYTAVSAGGDHTCVINGDGNAQQAIGTARCWGSDRYGQSTPQTGTFDSISAGKFHTCGLRQDGTVTCWGDNSYGQAPR